MSISPGYRLTYGMPREENGRRMVDSMMIDLQNGRVVNRTTIDLGPVPKFMLLPRLPLWKRWLRWLKKKH